MFSRKTTCPSASVGCNFIKKNISNIKSVEFIQMDFSYFSHIFSFVLFGFHLTFSPGSLRLHFDRESDDNSSGETEGWEGNKRNETDRQKECSFQDCSHQCHVCSSHPSLLSSYGGKNKLEKNTNLS